MTFTTEPSWTCICRMVAAPKPIWPLPVGRCPCTVENSGRPRTAITATAPTVALSIDTWVAKPRVIAVMLPFRSRVPMSPGSGSPGMTSKLSW